MIRVFAQRARKLEIWHLKVVAQEYHNVTNHFQVIFRECSHLSESVHTLKLVVQIELGMHFRFWKVLFRSWLNKTGDIRIVNKIKLIVSKTIYITLCQVLALNLPVEAKEYFIKGQVVEAVASVVGYFEEVEEVVSDGQDVYQTNVYSVVFTTQTRKHSTVLRHNIEENHILIELSKVQRLVIFATECIVFIKCYPVRFIGLHVLKSHVDYSWNDTYGLKVLFLPFLD